MAIVVSDLRQICSFSLLLWRFFRAFILEQPAAVTHYYAQISSYSARCGLIIGLNSEFVIAVVSVVCDDLDETFLRSSENQFFGNEIKGGEISSLHTYFHSLCLISLLFQFSWRPRPLVPSLVKQAFRNFYHTTQRCLKILSLPSYL